MSENKPIVSILLSIYKVEEYLEECLDSILAQSYANLEIICVNNGSPDKCGKILEQYAKKDRRIKVITLKENRMLCGGRNAGLDNATGEFICFVDPDDWIEKDYIKVMVETILTKKDSNNQPYNLVINTSAVNYYIPEQGNIKILNDYTREEKEITILDVNGNSDLETSIPMWGRLYRKSFLDKYNIRFLDGINTDNIPYTFKILAHMKCFYCIAPKDATYWRRMITPDGAITPVVLFQNMEIPKCLENLYDYLKANKLAQDLRVPFHLFFTVCFSRHKDMPKYYSIFRNLMIKMENDIKSAPDTVYQQCDRDLCNLLIYTSDFFQFVDLYFSRPTNYGNYTLKLFNLIPVFKKKTKVNKTKFYVFGVPVFVSKTKGNERKGYLFGIIPLLKSTYK